MLLSLTQRADTQELYAVFSLHCPTEAVSCNSSVRDHQKDCQIVKSDQQYVCVLQQFRRETRQSFGLQGLEGHLVTLG
jgi:hypothetical protein